MDNGWLWFIPLGPTRTSLGFVCPAEYYKKSGKKPEQLYREAIAQSERITKLIANGTAEGPIQTTKDWSFCAERTSGENWFLVGEAAGFADPILSAGLTLAHTGARELAFTIIELDSGEHDAAWLKEHYDQNQRRRVLQHIRFADYWYASNGLFTNLQEHCQDIAKDAGLRLTPQGAWAWLAQGGFANDTLGQAGIGGFDLAAMKQITRLFTMKDVKWNLNDVNVLKLNLTGAKQVDVPVYDKGRILKTTSYVRDSHHLAMAGMYGLLVDLLNQYTDVGAIYERLNQTFSAQFSREHAQVAMQHALQCLEVMLAEGWVVGKMDKKRPSLMLHSPMRGKLVHDNRDEEIMAERRAAKNVVT